MSAAASKLEIESPSASLSALPDDEISAEEQAVLEKLAGMHPPGQSGEILAIDLDDVLSETNEAVAAWHNEVYNSNMDLTTFYYYYYWKNPFWGTVKATFDKVKAFYATDRIFQAKPVPGAREGIETLRELGYRLIIVTARSPDTRENSWNWVERHFPGAFESIVCTGQFKEDLKNDAHTHEVVTKLTKAQVCADLKARLLIDDSAENAIQCATASPATAVLLFGDNAWNQRLSGPGDACDAMSFDIRLQCEGGKEFWKEEKLEIPAGAPLHRVKDWSEVVRWIKKARSEGIM
ncbi:hypothetical protein C8J56DRAFT_771367 [Mycena floridula]|nr:hypothetical protein C8J56DRAFT_771367 [Mycena floridula]